MKQTFIIETLVGLTEKEISDILNNHFGENFANVEAIQ